MLRWGEPTALIDLVWVVAYYAIFVIGWKMAFA
jgi:hypothetical protein